MRVQQVCGHLQLSCKRRMHFADQCSDWVPRRHGLPEQAGEGVANRGLRFGRKGRIDDLRAEVSTVEITVTRQLKTRQRVGAGDMQMNVMTALAPVSIASTEPEPLASMRPPTLLLAGNHSDILRRVLK
jgi:hypothetical protein